MKEELLVHVWQYKLFDNYVFNTSDGENIEILSFGVRNLDSGPDFFNAKIKIGNQIWAGNVEIHINSSDWYKHKHQIDKAYSNVILHVVFNHDKEVEIGENILPVLELKNHISDNVIKNYSYLSKPSKSFLSCKNSYVFKSDFEYDNWLDRLYVKRLEKKTENVINQLNISVSHWEQVLFRSISRSFGLKLNGDAFANFSSSFDFKIVQQLSNNKLSMEALFFGQSGFFEGEENNEYFMRLKNEYIFIQQKYSLTGINNSQFKFFRTRPANFPTIRLAQLASLYSVHTNLFSKIIESNSVEFIKSLFDVEIDSFWKNHYNFSKESKETNKKLTNSFVELIILNAIIPVRFIYFKSINSYDKIEESLEFAQGLKKENNIVVNEFEKYGWTVKNAKESQALLQLKNDFCIKNNCMDCLIGKRVLQKKV